MAVFILVMYNQCGNPYVARPTELTFADGAEGGSLATMGSVEAFENSVYKITRQRCAGCHASQNPVHASDDVQEAHDIVVNQFKVNFSNIPNSRLVKKLVDETHNCWTANCAENALEMQNAIQVWADAVNQIEEDIESDNNSGGTGSVEEGDGYIVVPGISSQEAFEQTVYPITSTRCTTCHINTFPKHSNSNKVIAHNDLVDGAKVDFQNVLNSRIVQRLQSDQHNCWSNCDDDAMEMKAAIDQWLALMEDSFIPDPNGGSIPSTEPLTTAMSATVAQITSSDNTSTVDINATTGSIMSPFTVVGGSSGHIEIPSGLAFNSNSSATNVGRATYNFNISKSGSYKMRMSVVATPSSKDSVYISIDNENFFDWHIPNSPVFTNQVVTRTSGRADKTWNLTAGSHTLVVNRRESDLKYTNIQLYEDNGIGVEPGVGLLEYDLSQILGVNEEVYLRAKIKEFDEFSYQIWDVEIVSNLNIRVKNIKTLINGYYNPQHSVYTVVDTVITPNMSSVSPYYLLALKDKGINSDRFSFKFEVLEVDN